MGEAHSTSRRVAWLENRISELKQERNEAQQAVARVRRWAQAETEDGDFALRSAQRAVLSLLDDSVSTDSGEATVLSDEGGGE